MKVFTRTSVRGATWLSGLLIVSGCGHAIRDLAKDEHEYLTAVRNQVRTNGTSIEHAVEQIGGIYETAAAQEREFTVNAVAKARLLESLTSPWSAPPSQMQATQRAVVLFHLYDLAAAQQRAFEAEQTVGRGARGRIMTNWNRIAELLDTAITNQQIILKDLNQPPDHEAEAVLANFFTEARAFQGELAKSEDDELKRLAARTDHALDQLDKSKEQMQKALEFVHGLANIPAAALKRNDSSGGTKPDQPATAKPIADNSVSATK